MKTVRLRCFLEKQVVWVSDPLISCYATEVGYGSGVSYDYPWAFLKFSSEATSRNVTNGEIPDWPF